MKAADVLLALSLDFANINYSAYLKEGTLKNQEVPFVYAADFVWKHKNSRIFFITEYAHEPRCRSPPLLKFWFIALQNFRRRRGKDLVYKIFSQKESHQRDSRCGVGRDER